MAVENNADFFAEEEVKGSSSASCKRAERRIEQWVLEAGRLRVRVSGAEATLGGSRGG